MNMHSNSKERGQVLILAIIMLVILLLAIMIIFDVHTFIRAKLKLETASQSAALTAAKWQRTSLNLIGEINLTKACDILTDDIMPLGSSYEQLDNSCKALTEMQTRIAFIGPLIGFGAANQTMKNNGVNPSDSSDFNGMIDDYITLLQSGARYNNEEVDDEGYINNYLWKGAYIGMLQQLRDDGVALRPNGRFPGLEGIQPPWMADRNLWKAINSESWCQPTLNAIIKYDDSYWAGKWWKLTFQRTGFPGESEILTLGVDFNANDMTTFNAVASEAQAAGLNPLTASGSDPVITGEKLPAIKWCTYDYKWYPTLDDGSINYASDAPDTSSSSYWRRGRWLRANLKDSVKHGGAYAVASCSQNFTPANKYKAKVDNPGGKNTQLKKVKESFAKYDENGALLDTYSPNSVKVGGDAVAQPIGDLNGAAPIASPVILPVFKNTILIPTTIRGNHNMMPIQDDEDIIYDQFLEWLADVDDIHSPSSAPPPGSEQMLAAFRKLDTASWRKQGYNNDYSSGSVSDETAYFGSLYKYNADINPNGAGWLQQVYVAGISGASFFTPENTISEDIGNGKSRVWLGNRFIIRKMDGSYYTNDEYICYGERGGGGNYTLGSQSAPPRL